MCGTSVSHVSQGNFALQRASQESMPRETVARQRERCEREGSVISATESMSKINRQNSTGCHSLRTHRDSMLMNDISENTLNEEVNRIFLVKIQFREIFFSTEWNMEIQNLERRNSGYALFESQRELESQRRQMLEANQWADQAQRQRIQCVVNWR